MIRNYEEIGINRLIAKVVTNNNDCENLSTIIQYPIPIVGYILKAGANDGSPITGTNTDTDVADSVTKKHSQNTDSGTSLTSWKINSGGNDVELLSTGMTGDRDFLFPNIDTMLAGSVLLAQNNFEIIEYT